MDKYQIIIIGAGPAGFAAGIYSSRALFSTLILESTAAGGQVITTDIIENYPGFPDGIKGSVLMDQMEKQAKRFGAKLEYGRVSEIKYNGKEKLVVLEDGKTLSCQAIIIAVGSKPNELGIPGEKEFRGKGVSYCATCDGSFFRNQDIVVVGGGDAALEETLFLTRFANNIYLIHRRDQLRGTKILQEKIFNNAKTKIIWNSIIKGIEGITQAERVKIENVQTNEISYINCSGIFIYVGTGPNTEFLKNIVQIDEKGYIITDTEMKTNVPGIFAAGDVRKKILRQVITATADGAIAAISAERYINEEGG